MMNDLFQKTKETELFWAKFVADKKIEATHYDVVAFGDSPQMADELALLVLEGAKRATACLYRDVVNKTENIPLIGGYVVLVDGAGSPRAIWQTTELRLGPMVSVSEEFAYLEGEGERTRADWLLMHRRYFERQAKREGWQMHDQIEVIFEKFEIVYQ